MEIVKYPHKKLRWKRNQKLYTNPVTPGMDLIGEQMYRTMLQNNGIGLAAPQVGLSMRMFVTSELPDRLIINPIWNPTPAGYDYTVLEGCLSFPGWLVPVKRFDCIKAAYYNVNGKQVELVLKGLAAQVFQHETDHLNGVLMIDHLTEAQKATLERHSRRSD